MTSQNEPRWSLFTLPFTFWCTPHDLNMGPLALLFLFFHLLFHILFMFLTIRFLSVNLRLGPWPRTPPLVSGLWGSRWSPGLSLAAPTTPPPHTAAPAACPADQTCMQHKRLVLKMQHLRLKSLCTKQNFLDKEQAYQGLEITNVCCSVWIQR